MHMKNGARGTSIRMNAFLFRNALLFAVTSTGLLAVPAGFARRPPFIQQFVRTVGAGRTSKLGVASFISSSGSRLR